MSRSHLNRRQFMDRSLAAAGVGAGFAIGGTKSSGRVIGANDTVRIAVAGLNGRGGSHVDEFAQNAGRRDRLPGRSRHQNIRQAAQADRETKVSRTPGPCRTSAGVLEDKNVDAISIATPNHWHALMTIWACQAGKDVYVEKPCSHNVHEGRVAVEAARKYNRIVQHGTQSRPSSDWAAGRRRHQVGQARQAVGLAGSVLQAAQIIGVKPNTKPPPNSRLRHLARPRARSSPTTPTSSITTGTGSGISATATSATRASTRWTSPAGSSRHSPQARPCPRPSSAWAAGSATRTRARPPNTQISRHGLRRHAAHLRGPRPARPTASTARRSATSPTSKRGRSSPARSSSPRGSQAGEPLASLAQDRAPSVGPGDGHFGNFIAAVRSRKADDLNADILEGHYSTALCHLANISYRLGEDVPFNKPRPRPSATTRTPTRRSSRMEEHLKDNSVGPRRPELSARPQADLRRRDRIIRRRCRGQSTADQAIPIAIRAAGPTDLT